MLRYKDQEEEGDIVQKEYLLLSLRENTSLVRTVKTKRSLVPLHERRARG